MTINTIMPYSGIALVKPLLPIALVFLHYSGELQACSTCLCGDPTLTVMGAEKPYSGRKRVSFEHLTRTESIGKKNVDRVETDEQRLTLGLSYTINKQFSVAARLPLIDKHMETANLSEADTRAAGDLDLTMRIYLQSSEGLFSHHQYTATLGLRIPTGQEQESDSGEPLDIDVQPGVGSLVPQAGLWYTSFRFPWMIHLSSNLLVSSEGDQDLKPGIAIATTVMTQYATDYSLAWQLGVDSRWSDKDEFDGVPDANSGGWLSYLSPGLVYTLATDLLLNLRVQIPLVDALNGDHDESQTFSAGITYDF